jgi:SARP family transcriptional regulator, regulator of embCAB operon
MGAALSPNVSISYRSVQRRQIGADPCPRRDKGVPMTDAMAREGLVGLPRASLRPGDPPAPMFSLLGPVAVRTDDRDYAPTAPRLLQLLALLMMRSNRRVHPESIAREVWSDGTPPADLRAGVHALVAELRACIEGAGPAAAGRHVLAIRRPGYVLRVRPDQIDVLVFQQLVQQGLEAFRSGHFDEAARLLRTGLDLWSGDPMANVPCGPVLSAYAVELREQLRAARYLRIQADIEAGRAEELLGELRTLVTDDPLDEGIHAQLMHVLGILGRRSEALTLYRQLRERLVDELGLEPSEQLQDLRRDVLRAGLRVR